MKAVFSAWLYANSRHDFLSLVWFSWMLRYLSPLLMLLFQVAFYDFCSRIGLSLLYFILIYLCCHYSIMEFEHISFWNENNLARMIKIWFTAFPLHQWWYDITVVFKLRQSAVHIQQTKGCFGMWLALNLLDIFLCTYDKYVAIL
jgi:hypothetical protein